MRILITGGAGFIGSNLANTLISRGDEVTMLDTLSPQIHGEDETSTLFHMIKPKVNFILGSVTDRKILRSALAGQDAVVHFAAETGTGQSMYEIERYTHVNQTGTGILLDLITNDPECRVRKIVVASSRSIYGEGKYKTASGKTFYPDERNEEDLKRGDFDVRCPETGGAAECLATDENSMLHPSSIYGLTKLNQEQMSLIVGRSLGIGTVALRYQNVFGPGQSLKNPYTGILSIFSNLILNDTDINIFEDGQESRDFVYIDDVVKATVLALDRKEDDQEVFNVGSGIQTTVMQVAQLLNEMYQKDVSLNVTGNFRLGDIRHNYADLSKAKSVLGFEPKWHFKDGLLQFTQWVLEQKRETSVNSYSRSLDEMRRKGLLK